MPTSNRALAAKAGKGRKTVDRAMKRGRVLGRRLVPDPAHTLRANTRPRREQHEASDLDDTGRFGLRIERERWAGDERENGERRDGLYDFRHGVVPCDRSAPVGVGNT